MKARYIQVCVWVAVLSAGPARLLADFSFDEIPTFVEDQAPNWLFQILSAIFLAIAQLFSVSLFGIEVTA